MTAYFAWEAALLLWIQNHLRVPVLTPIMTAVTHLGDHGLFWILLTVFLLILPKTRKAGLASALALIFSLIINNIILKNAIARVRPYELIQGLELIVTRATDYSFPSGHTGASFASALAMFPDIPRPWNIVLVILASVIAFSRLFVGIHYPTDVLGGLVTGMLAAWLARLLLPRLCTLFTKKEGSK